MIWIQWKCLKLEKVISQLKNLCRIFKISSNHLHKSLQKFSLHSTSCLPGFFSWNWKQNSGKRFCSQEMNVKPIWYSRNLIFSLKSSYQSGCLLLTRMLKVRFCYTHSVDITTMFYNNSNVIAAHWTLYCYFTGWLIMISLIYLANIVVF